MAGLIPFNRKNNDLINSGFDDFRNLRHKRKYQYRLEDMTAHKRRYTTQPFALCKLSYITVLWTVPHKKSEFSVSSPYPSKSSWS